MAGLYQPCRQSVTKLLFLGETTKINKEKIRERREERGKRIQDVLQKKPNLNTIGLKKN
mgnify:FL=1